MVHWYQEVVGDYKPLDKGEMYYADVSASLSASIYKAAGAGNVKGKTVLFDKDKYCIYDYGGFAVNISYGIPVVDTTISLGIAHNIYKPLYFEGKFDALYTYNILKGGKITATGVSARTGGVYFPITDDSGKAIAAAAKEAILNTNGVGFDRKDYKLLLNNCDQNARRWMKAGGIEIDTGSHTAPNMIYMYMTRKIDAKVGIYSNAKYGDFKEIWDEIHKSKDCITVD